jgi:prevent-host-death family protein
MKKERTIAAATFKAECLALLDEVASTGRSIVVTKRGRAVARVVPVERLKPGALKGTIRFIGDVVGPLDVDWEAGR